MSQADTPDDIKPDNETDEWVEERRDELERLANSDYKSAWVAERMLQSEEGGES